MMLSTSTATSLQGWTPILYHDVEHFHCNLTGVPWSGGQWPAALGGFPFGARKAPSLAFLEELRESGQPMWPEDEGLVEAAVSGAISSLSNNVSERIAFAPGWLADSWNPRGSLGAWDRVLLGRDPEQVGGKRMGGG